MNSVEVTNANIRKLPVDVIMNAANESLMGGSGVDGAIQRAAGPNSYLNFFLLSYSTKAVYTPNS